MSIGSIGSVPNWWTSQNQAAQGSATTAGSTAAGGSITSTGSPTAAANTTAFMQAFSADLQSILTQAANSTATTQTSSASAGTTDTCASSQSGTTAGADASSQTANSQTSGEVHHHHHHHDGGDSDPMQSSADKLVGQIGQSLQSGTLTAGQIDQSANLFASDVMRALQSYGATAANAPAQSVIA
jgi:hypothetical protein